ncbi:MAG: FkbM family methyltransferase [Bacteroidota bacterium]
MIEKLPESIKAPIRRVWLKRQLPRVIAKIKAGNVLEDLPAVEREDWKARIKMVQEAPDNALIPRHPDAGKLIGGDFVMHNGIRINPMSYYSSGNLVLLEANKGVHEPQEEYVFQEVLKSLEPGSVMIELGAFWAFYSLWFQEVVPEAKSYMVEPVNVWQGQENFRLNRKKGVFKKAMVGAKPAKLDNGEEVVSVDSFVKAQNISRIDILHSDIQGYELDMLKGCEEVLRQGLVRYFFISTHSNELHDACVDFLKEAGFEILNSVNKDQSYAFDGLLVAHNPKFGEPVRVETSIRK